MQLKMSAPLSQKLVEKPNKKINKDIEELDNKDIGY